MQQTPAQQSVEARHHVLLIMWGAFLASIVIYFLVAYFVRPAGMGDGGGDNNLVIIIVLMMAGVSMVVLSFVIKNGLLAQAASRQRINSVQVAYIVAFALCESAALMGLVATFITAEAYSFLLFVIGAVGLLLHMPRRDHLLAAASFKK
ncbi:MAG: hypothetical protein H0W76_24215 [Pyrinomonadaceae bacterium]|nr:hypothetical protein [Pyrinomonadaceae bacterium]